MNIDQAFPSKYIKSSDLGSQDQTYTIKRVTLEKLGQGANIQTKPVLYFNEVEKGFACNKTNANTIGKLYGAETDAWIGKKIILWVKPDVEFQGQTGPAIRVRTQPGGNGTPSQAYSTMPPPPNLEYGKEYAKATTSMSDWLTFCDSCHVILGKDKYYKILGGIGFEKAEQVGFDDQQRTAAMLWLFDMQPADKQMLLEKHGTLLRKLNIIHA